MFSFLSSPVEPLHILFVSKESIAGKCYEQMTEE
jgi:hypothetical protein